MDVSALADFKPEPLPAAGQIVTVTPLPVAVILAAALDAWYEARGREIAALTSGLAADERAAMVETARQAMPSERDREAQARRLLMPDAMPLALAVRLFHLAIRATPASQEQATALYDAASEEEVQAIMRYAVGKAPAPAPSTSARSPARSPGRRRKS